MKLTAFVSILLISSAAFAQRGELVDPPWIKQVAVERVHFTLPGMDRIQVKKDVVYKSAPGGDLRADIYSPSGRKPVKGHPAVIFIHGGTLPPNLKTTIKDWGVYISYGRLAAASGFIGVTFNSRFYDWAKTGDPQSDVRDLVAYVRTNAKTLGADPDRISLWAFSAGGILLSDQLSSPQRFVRSIIAYYPVLDPKDLRGRIPQSVSDEELKSFSPAHIVAAGNGKLPPLLVARAGLDAELNTGVDAFIAAALSKNLTIEILNHPNGQHAFDVLDDDQRTREVIRRTLEFLKTHG